MHRSVATLATVKRTTLRPPDSQSSPVLTMGKRAASNTFADWPRTRRRTRLSDEGEAAMAAKSETSLTGGIDIEHHFNQFKLPSPATDSPAPRPSPTIEAIGPDQLNDSNTVVHAHIKEHSTEVIIVDDDDDDDDEIEIIEIVRDQQPSSKATVNSTKKTATTKSAKMTARVKGVRHRSLAPLLPKPELGHPPPRVLIVGTGPSEASLQAQQYYAYKHNHMWPIMAALLGFDASLNYPSRVTAVTSRGIAVWDTLETFERKGSLDSAIKNVQHTDIASLLDRFPTIKRICCNGALAYKECRKSVSDAELARRGVDRVQMPSSSPAHAMKDAVVKKSEKWRVALRIDEHP